MSKNLVSLFTLVSFIFFSVSCYTIEKAKVKTVDDWKGKDVEVLGVVKKSGETIEFPRKQPSRIHEDSIIGMETEEIEIEKSNIKKISRNEKRKILMVITKDGKIYMPISTREQEDKIVCTVYKLIPLSEIDMIFVKKIDTDLTLLTAILATAGGIYLLARIMWQLSGGINLEFY